jgi:hypothetical protein
VDVQREEDVGHTEGCPGDPQRSAQRKVDDRLLAAQNPKGPYEQCRAQKEDGGIGE